MIQEHERKYLNDILAYRVDHTDVVVELAQISKWKHLGYDIITMAGELDRVQKNKHGSYRHLVMNTDYDLLMLRDRHLPTEQCLADVIDSAMWPYK